MCDGPIDTVKYIWVNISYMLDWIFLQNCRNSFPLHNNWSTSGEYKILEAAVSDELLVVNANAGSYQIEEHKNSSLVVILHCLNSF